jgi:molybdopterin-guanine dinucleotide biosynthesis protein A
LQDAEGKEASPQPPYNASLVNDVAAFVLAGGESRRMGRDKALIEVNGRTLLARMLETVGAVTSSVQVVGSPAKYGAFAPVVPDIYPERGPLGGIHAALRASSHELNLVVGVDLVHVTADLVRYLVGLAQGSTAVVTVPRAAGYLQPLCAVYRRAFAALAGEALELGRNKVDALYDRCAVRVIEEAELRTAGFDPAVFTNVNTPENLEAARRHLE